MDVSKTYQAGTDAVKLLESDQTNNKQKTAAAQGATQNDPKNSEEKPAAVYEHGNNDYNVDMDQVRRMIQQANDQTLAFRKMIEALLNRQGMTLQQAFGRIDSGESFMIDVDEATRQKALEDISEDGYYGVKQTSERILNFAKALSGGDPSKIEMLRDAVMEGFKAAEEAWGGKLPEISYQTLDAVMRGFDEWAQNASASNTSK